MKRPNNVFNANLDVLNVLMETHVSLVINLAIFLISMAHVIVLKDTILMVESVFHVLIVSRIANNVALMENHAHIVSDN